MKENIVMEKEEDGEKVRSEVENVIKKDYEMKKKKLKKEKVK